MRKKAYLLLHLGRHLALDDLERNALGCACCLALVADGETALAQELADLIDEAFLAVGAWRLNHIVGRRRRVVLVLVRLELGYCLGLELVRSRYPLGVRIPRRQCLHVDTPCAHPGLCAGDGRDCQGILSYGSRNDCWRVSVDGRPVRLSGRNAARNGFATLVRGLRSEENCNKSPGKKARRSGNNLQ